MRKINIGAASLAILLASVLTLLSVPSLAQVVERGRTFADLTASHPCDTGLTNRIARVTDCDAADDIGDGEGAFQCWAICDGSAPWVAQAIGGGGSGGGLPGANQVTEAMLKCVNAPTDEYVLTYESTTGDFEWQAAAGGISDGDKGDITVTGTGATWTIDANSVALGTDTTGNYAGSSSEGGAATTATALAADPADCAANQFATTIAASGALTCSALADADVPDSITVTLAATATALAANGANCSAGSYPLGVNASGAAETCTAAVPFDSPTFTTQITTPSVIGGASGTSTLTLDGDSSVAGSVTVSADGRILAVGGNATTPGYSFAATPGIGMFDGGAGELTFDGTTQAWTLGGTYKMILTNTAGVAGLQITTGHAFSWGAIGGTSDAGLARVSAGVVKVTNGSTGDGDLRMQDNIEFEGSTADAFETQLAVTNPTAARTITLPDATGTVSTFVGVPANAAVACSAGQYSYDASYFYVCTASGAWMRAAVATW